MFMLLLVLTTADLFNMIPIQLSDKIFAFVDKLQISLTARVSVDSLQMEEAARLLQETFVTFGTFVHLGLTGQLSQLQLMTSARAVDFVGLEDVMGEQVNRWYCFDAFSVPRIQAFELE